MIKTIIIDDEQHAADRLATMLEKYCSQSVQLAGIFHTVEDGVKATRELRPQLLLLDVQIHDKTGFDLLQQFPQNNFDVIFVTAFEKYAITAFKFSAVDYLLKPVDPNDLQQAIEKINNKRPIEELTRKFETLLENVAQLKQYTPPNKIMVPTINGFELLPVADILRCQSEINYTSIFMKDKQKIVVAKTLKEFEEMLEEYNFFRVHNSHLVNLAYVKSYNKGKGGFLTMTDQSQIEVSTRRKELFLKKLAER